MVLATMSGSPDMLAALRLRRACPDCGTEMEYVSAIDTGSSNADGPTCDSLYQCPKCKTITVLP